jgi:hypothetical protein
MKNVMWMRVLPDGMMILGAGIIFVDLVKKSLLAKRSAA